MQINKLIKKSVAFVQYKMADGTHVYCGTCFFVIRDNKNSKYQHTYLVTAKHIIDGIRNLGLDQVFIRINLKDGSVKTFLIGIDEWILHEDYNVDVAILPIAFNEDVDHLYYPESSFVDAETIEREEIDCGDETVITGFFRHHSGANSNLPILRVGNIAMMPGEKVQTSKHLMDAYLIECRSIGGLSGSPVFINYGPVRSIKGRLGHEASSEIIHNLLGLVYGHFDSKETEIDATDANFEEAKKINVGIAIVTPSSKITELFNTERVRQSEKESESLVDDKK